MPSEEILRQRLVGIRPFNGLPIDEIVWKQSHELHANHRQLHAAYAHCPGIIYGLDVVVSAKTNEVIVGPGVAIDAEGRTLLVEEAKHYDIKETGRVYIWLYYRQEETGETKKVKTVDQRYKLREGYNIETINRQPDVPGLELARITRSSNTARIRTADNPYAPGEDELNLLFRPVAFPHCCADMGLGEISYVPDEGVSYPNRRGLCSLIQEGQDRGFCLRFTGPTPLREDANYKFEKPGLIYIAGKSGMKRPLDNDAKEYLNTFLRTGGVLFTDSAPGSAFDKAIGELLASAPLRANLQPVTQGHPLLSQRYMFSAPPHGAHPHGALHADMELGVVRSTCNYGGAWQGEVENPQGADARERIRQSVEFGLNIVAFAAARRHAQTLLELSNHASK